MVNSVNTTIIPITSTTPTNDARQPASGAATGYPVAGDISSTAETRLYGLGLKDDLLSDALANAREAGKDQDKRIKDANAARAQADATRHVHDQQNQVEEARRKAV